MSRRTNDNPINENWIKTETLKHHRLNAKNLAEIHQEFEASKKVIATPHPTSPRAFILKYV